MMSARKFQNVVIATIVGWLLLFVFLPNLMIIGTSFLTRDDAHFVSMVFSLDNYARLLDPLYFQVLLHSLNMALIATVACLVLGYPFAWFLARLPERVRRCAHPHYVYPQRGDCRAGVYPAAVYGDAALFQH